MPAPAVLSPSGGFDADDTLGSADRPARRRTAAAVSVAALMVYAAYLWYRAAYTLNPDAWVFSLLVYFAEVHGFFSLFLYFHQLWHLRTRRVVAPPPDLRVDVFVTTYNEDVAMLRQTLRGAVAIRYPHETYVLDDGRRPEVRALAQEIGCQYISRADNTHAKAGNFNYAFQRTTADFIATFDADHVPQPDFLDRTLGFLRDARVAFVQVPQVFHNLDSVQHKVSWRARRLYSEQDAFFNLVMPGKDHWNAAFFCGTGAVLRRAALEPHGGLLTDTITEDLHTSVVLHAAGWKSVYLNERLVTGLAPVDLRSFATQRLRWAEGNLRAARVSNPLTVRGLTLAQRVSYLASLYHWTIGIPKLIYYLAPPWILFSGTFPIARFDATFISVYLAFLTTLVVSYQVVSRGKGRLLMDELFNMVSFFTLLRAVKRMVVGRRESSRFAVTSKRGSAERELGPVLPHLLLLGFSTLAIAWSLMGLGFGVTDDVRGAGIAIFWTLYNLGLVVGVLRLGTRPGQKREASRFRANFAVEGRGHGANAGRLGVTADIGEGGCSLLWPAPLTQGQHVPVTVHFGPRDVDWVVEVAADLGRQADGWYRYGVRFVDQGAQDVDLINDMVFSLVVPDLFTRLTQPSWLVRQWRRLVLLLTRPLRGVRRQHVRVPVRVCHGGGRFVGTVRDLSGTGLSVQAPLSLPVGTEVSLTMFAPDRTWDGTASVVRADARPSRAGFETWVLGLRFSDALAAAAVNPFQRSDAA